MLPEVDKISTDFKGLLIVYKSVEFVRMDVVNLIEVGVVVVRTTAPDDDKLVDGNVLEIKLFVTVLLEKEILGCANNVRLTSKYQTSSRYVDDAGIPENTIIL